MTRSPTFFALIFISLVTIPWIHGASFTTPETSSANSDDGTIQLEWTHATEADATYEVRRSFSPDFTDSKLVYTGGDTATFVSGLPEGDHYIKVRSKAPGGAYAAWSTDTLVVKVEYIDSRLVIALMTAGFITFVAIIVAIVTGHRRTEAA